MEKTKIRQFLDYILGVTQLIRLPNLLIIILTMYLLRYCVLGPILYADSGATMSGFLDFTILVAVTVLIAMGGYVINDYFDVRIDRVNKPGKLVIDRIVPARSAIVFHLIINGIATALGLYLAWRVRSLSFGLIFPVLAGLLWFYSVRYKRMLFWGNLVVAALSSFVILIVLLYEFFYLRQNPEDFVLVMKGLRNIYRIFLAYALFAFLVSLFREVIKDMEDWQGDEQYGCRTLPLVLGIERTRWISFSLMILNMILLGYGMIILYRLDLMAAFWYFLIAVQVPVVYLLYLVARAKTKPDYHLVSMITKILMLAGILSMQLLTM